MEAAEVSQFVGVEEEDGEQKGHGLPVIPRGRSPVRHDVKVAKNSLITFLWAFLPLVRPRLQSARMAAMVEKSSLFESDSSFLELAETDLLRQGSLFFFKFKI